MMFRFKSYYQPTPGDVVLEKLAWKKWGEKRGKRIRFSVGLITAVFLFHIRLFLLLNILKFTIIVY